MSISRNLKEARLAAKLSQEQVAEQLFVTRQTVSGWETGRTQPDLETLGKLTALYGVGLDRIIYGVDYDDRTARRRRKLILISRVFAGIVVAGMLSSAAWRLLLSHMWPPPEGVRELVMAGWDALYGFQAGLGTVMKLTMLILLVLDAVVGDRPTLKRRWFLWGGTMLAVAGVALLFALLDSYRPLNIGDYLLIPVLQYFVTPTLHLLLSTAIWLVRKRMKK